MAGADNKTFIRVEAWFGEDGMVHPTCVIWGNGKRYPVGHVLDVRPSVCIPADGAGIRYTVCIGGRVTHLYRTGTRWFVEKKQP